MNAMIADILKTNIESLPFIDRLSGLVRTVSIKEESGRITRKPIACDVSSDDCARGTYQDLVPNSSKLSIVYFEENGGVQPIGNEKNNYVFRSQLRMVGWLNLKKMGFTNCTWSGNAVLQILSRLPRNVFNSGNFQKIKITAIAEAEKSAENIFGKYTYDETVNQYLLYPFDYFALNITTEFQVNPDCIEEMNMEEELCADPSAPSSPSTVTDRSRRPIVFYTTNGKTDYTATDVPELSRIVGREIASANMDSTVLIPSVSGGLGWTWDNVTFSIIGIPATGNEYIVIFPK